MARSGRFRFKLDLERNALLLFWAMFFMTFAFGTSERFKPLYIESLGARPALVGIVLGVAEGFRLLFLIISGPLSSRVSARILINMRWLTVLHAFVFLVATQWWMLFPAFLAQAGANLAWPSFSRVIDESGSESTRGSRFLLIYTIAPGLALIPSPLIGALIVDHFGLRAVYVPLLLFLVISCMFLLFVKPVEAEVRTVSGGYLEVLHHAPSRSLCALAFASSLVAWLGLTLAPNFLHNEKGLSFGLIGAFGTLVAVGSIVMGLLLTRSTRLSRSLNGTLLTLSFVPLVFLLMLGGQAAAIFGVAYLVVGLTTVAHQSLYGPLSEVTPPEMRVMAYASLEIAVSFGIMIAGFASGVLYAFDPSTPMIVALVGSLAVIAGTLWVRRDVIARATANALPETLPVDAA